MEKSIALLILMSFSFWVIGQDDLCVFETQGAGILMKEGNVSPVMKGDLINKKSTLTLGSAATLIAINKQGDAYKVMQEGDYSYKDLLQHSASKEDGSLTKKYFKLVWNEIVGATEERTIIGGVFRGEQLMTFPIDSAQIAGSKLTFQWTTEEVNSHYFLFLRNAKTDQIVKYGVSGTELTLYRDHDIFKDSEEFEWSVSASEFPNLNNIVFNSFTLIDRARYNENMENYKGLMADLKALGLSINQIENSICETYGICK